MANLPANYKDLKLTDIMPVNLSHDRNVLETSRAIDIELHKVASLVDELYLMNKIDKLSEDVINLLAWQWHVDFYDESLSLEQKRRLVKSSVSWHKVKGTKKAIEIVCDIVYGESDIKEWFEYGGNPYYFKIYMYDAPMRQEELKRIWKMINIAKNVRSWLEELIFIRKMHSKRYVGAFPFLNKEIEILPNVADNSESCTNKYIAFVPYVSKDIEVFPNVADNNESFTDKYLAFAPNISKDIEIFPKISDGAELKTNISAGGCISEYKEIEIIPHIRNAKSEGDSFCSCTTSIHKEITT